MKIDRSRVRKSTSDVPIECQQLIERLQACSRTELLEELSKINTWTFGKCELLHWALVLDVFDKILGEAGRKSFENKWALKCDTHYNSTEKKLLLWILHFTTLLIEHSFSRHLYNSLEHLLVLLESNDMSVVLGVLNLLYMFSKRSNFISRLSPDKKNSLLSRLHHLAENWGGKENGFGLADCCRADETLPFSATTVHVEFHRESDDPKEAPSKNSKNSPHIIHIEHVDKIHRTPAEIMKSLLGIYYVPPDKQMWLFTRVRLAYHFADYNNRLLCVQARLQALSVLVYSNAIQDSPHNLLYNGLLEELVELVEMKDPHLVEIRSAALRTLTAIIHLDRNPHIPKKPGSRLNNIIDVTGASQYHGFLPLLVRNCIITLTNQSSENQSKKDDTEIIDVDCDEAKVMENSDVTMSPQQIADPNAKFPLSLATALFSFLYHLASYEAGGEALVSCGMMESLLQVINWHGVELEHITFVTRAVRVIDLITNIDMQAFQTHGGLQSFINRLDVEVKLCKAEQLYEIKTTVTDQTFLEEGAAGPSTEAPENSSEPTKLVDLEYHSENVGKTCLPQRAALLKSMLNFLKKALQDSTFSDNIRHLMEGTLPNSLKNIIANAEYYGPSLFLLATDVVTVYVYQEPSLLSALQDNGLIEVVLHSLLVKEIPATREVLGSLPNVFSALCLNNRGLQQFIKMKPFEKTFSVLLSPDYLPAMRRRRSSEPMADTACNLGNAMDELMRHQPSLKSDAIKAIIDLLEELVNLGTDPKYICWKPHSKSEVSPSSSTRSATNTEGSSDEEDEDEEEASTSSQNAQNDAQVQQENSERTPIALIDYILNTMKFIDAILSNNSTDDHCREFVQQGGLRPLLKILGLPNLPVNCPVTNPAQAVATVCKSILNLAHETNLFKEGLAQLSEVLEVLKPMYTKLDVPSGPKLLLELAGASNVENAFNNASVTPLLHAMGAAHGYIIMLVHVCRTGQSEIRNLSLQNWGSEEGLRVIKGLADLYTSLVWESTLLLAYCSEEFIPSDFTREDIEKLNAFFDKCESSNTGSDSTVNVASAMEALTTNPPSIEMDVDQEGITLNLSTSLKYIKPLLGASSRLGRALAELFGLLVKLCVGSPIRQRRGQNIIAAPPLPTPYARSVATALNVLLADGLDYERLPACPLIKSRITFLICSVGFTSPMLFDEKRYPYHLMLKKFVALGGQATFFNTFRWALSAGGTIPIEKAFEDGPLPEGTAGFLDAWLMLLEKMVNPKAILESPHIISNRSSQSSTYRGYNFDPLKYLIQIHKLAFEAVILLWNKAPLTTYGTRLSENILTVLRHILRGEKIIKEKLKSEENMSTDLSRPKSSSGNSSREPEVNPDSLRQLMDMGFSREHVTDALLNTLTVEQATDYLLTNPPSLYRISQSFMNSDEDDQMMQAIAISLGVSNNLPSVSKKRQIQDDGKPLAESLIDEFTNHALEACLRLLDNTPECVHKICELLVTIMKRNGRTFRDNLLDTLVKEIYENAKNVCYALKQPECELPSVAKLPCATRLANYLHLYILFFEVSSYFEMKIPCALAVHKIDLINLLIKLICMAEKVMSRSEKVTEPKWLASSFLLIDAASKVATCAHRKRNMHLSTTRVWRWFHLETGKWTPYSNSNNKLINDAYWNGEQSVRVICGRRRYTVTFSNMLQLNDESGNNRPICMTLINSGLSSCSDVFIVNLEESLRAELTEKEDKRCQYVRNLDKAQETKIIRACVKLMHLTIEKDLLHSILQICIRLTRDFELAKIFVQEGGVKCLIAMKQVREFPSFGILATILIRHTLEEPNTLSYAIEKIIRARTLSTIPPYYKELLYLTRQIGGAVTRSPETFFEVAKNILRVDTDVNREDVDSRIPVKTEPPTRTRAPPLEEVVSNEVICDLLNALLNPLEVVDDTQPQTSPQNAPPETSSTKPSESVTGDNNDSGSETPAQAEANADDQSEPIQSMKKMMLPKSVILKILGDAVVSYGPVARIITEYTYKAGSNECIKEDCTALAFILDYILPEADDLSDSDCATMCRMLIAAIASSNHSPEAQFTLVSEVRAALLRALVMPESTEKHSQVQLIAGIISIMIDNCPSSQARVKSQPPTPQMNNIVRLMIRKSLFNDLARVPHFLDLSSPNTPFTVNACLKSLEALSRIVNQPVPANVQKSRKNQQATDESAGTQSGTSTEGTNAQREVVIDDSVVIEDSENTEHDIAVVTSTIEVEANENENVLVHMIDQLLEQGNDNNQSFSDVASSRNHTMDIDEDGNLTFEHERDATEELMSTDSGESDSNPSDQVEDEENDDNEGDDENIDDADDTNYDDDDGSDRRRASYMDRNDDVLMIQYTNPGAENEVVTRMVAYPMGDHAAFPMPLFDEINNSSDHTGPIVHPLLLSRTANESNSNTATRTQRVTRARRYQYLFNPRNPNPPVILQRLLGPHEPQVTLASANSILGGPPEMRESARLVVMDNFGLLPSHEEQIDFVDQSSGYLLGPSLAATLNHISPVLHWWNIESKCLDYESVYDVTTEVCNKLIPILIKQRNVEIVEKRKSHDTLRRFKFFEDDYIKPAEDSTEPNATDGTDEDIDGVPLETSSNDDRSEANNRMDSSPFIGFDNGTEQVRRNSRPSIRSDTVRHNEENNEGGDRNGRSVNPFEIPTLSPYTPPSRLPVIFFPPNVLHSPDAVEQAYQENNEENNESGDRNGRSVNPFGISTIGTLSPYTPPSRLTDMFSPSVLHPPEMVEHADQENNEAPLTRENEDENYCCNRNRPTCDSVGDIFEDSLNQQINSLANSERDPIPTEEAPTTNSIQESGEITAMPQQQTTSEPGPSSDQTEEIPDGVDPSFLEALPPDMRQEVLEQHRILRLQQRIAARTENPEAAAGTTTEVSPEFLAALPPSLQEEVLSQQRLEQQRQAAAQANPNEPVDAGAFFETLQPSLRTMILSDMEDSQMSALPPDLAAEAQTLRRDWEARNRQLVQERILQSNLTSIIRHSARARQQPLHHSSGHFHRAQWTHWNREFMNNSATPTPPLKIRGRQLLDHEGLSCLLVLLFTDDPHLGKLRLHRVIRNLCYHAPTREWIVNALLSIIDKSVHVKPDESLNKPARKMPKPGPLSSKLMTDSKLLQNNGNWLNIRMEAALGCSANVFIINRSSTGKRSDRSAASSISIHPQAAPIVCRNALDLFTSLAKAFPSCLLPLKCIRDDREDKNNLSPVRVKSESFGDFWEILLRLDSASTKKGKSIPKSSSSNTAVEPDNKVITFEQSVFGQLLNMLASPVVNRNTQLTDNLLRLLSVITSGMPELAKPPTVPIKATKNKLKENTTPTNALHLAVNVITYKNCSEEGLEFITNLLLNLASSTLEMSYMILNLLLSGAVRIGEIVREQINNMLIELKEYNAQKRKVTNNDELGPSTSKGTIADRFTKETVIITASTKVKASCELQLPSMVPLTSKSSSQLFFLRVLRVIVQIRNSFKQNVKRADASWCYDIPALSEQLSSIDSLWETLSQCLSELEHTPDHHAVLVLQPAVEAFFLVHSPQQGPSKKQQDTEPSSSQAPESRTTTSAESGDLPPAPSTENKFVNPETELHTAESTSKTVPPEQQKFLSFAEKHRRVLNQILRQSTSHLADGPFAVLVDHTRILDFDIKRRYFRSELERMDQGIRREETAVHVRRSNIFEDSFRELYRRTPEEWKNRFYIVFEDEEGQDAGGLLREWYVIISRDIFNPMYALFTVSPGDRVTYMINSASHYNPNHLCYYKFVGRVIAKAIYDNKLLECYFTRSFYKHILGIPVKYTDMESEDYSFYRGLVYLMENNINNLGLDLTFSTEINEFGVTETRDLIVNGRHVPVTEETKMEYIRLSCQMKMTGAIKQQLNAFLDGFYDIIPMRLISIFNEQELELLISGLPNVDIDDLKANTEYHKYQANSLQIQWFWRALRSFDQADRAKFLQFVTGTSKVPLQGFAALEGMNGVQKFQIHRDDRSTDRLPSAHTCFNQLDLPVYETYDKLRSYLLKAIHECSEGFGFA
ncbi:E3 ubiquitin-protein ligase HUWE1 [Tribolium castaneum]|uniref:HECT-type E3 ubiquitin transferase n=1 Tax=Tribolium castaneum TaxID=7070 RepID=D6W6Q2_TRICA|nr:PREDICTED: E3 ubiquitin-protein ligase HUWE1 [Tribolium castaneum]XP_008200047.1 PREDICTED: E3 ubiquitin-protein ligase HUWE1 [Tribolium castaneum]XP_008200048.1 PREDICTED: E3 ubiquitin-protein ligase HUWE1 [Tribolium castaneum]XP_008200049.1 PREDICTED: E3 ubiquitin-protein ligase HUWE1 [Tribolium castaneum]EFA10984.1 E3 ubiquitin-protein ligase HUWE1-like Protein [Tribolium castaneum]|eukprot:XP_008200046.1 PREDICTED: E3 ubiquitin-protein ligase HUWE1 [Tribolium castaneum]